MAGVKTLGSGYKAMATGSQSLFSCLDISPPLKNGVRFYLPCGHRNVIKNGIVVTTKSSS